MSKKLNICFCGSSEFSVPFLEQLHQDPTFNVAAVLTRCDQPAHRGKQLTPNKVKQRAQALLLPVLDPASLVPPVQGENLRAQFKELEIDVVIVVAYGLLIPAHLLTICKFGWLNIHASLLPRWRGAAPIARAILEGDQHAGISIMQIEAGLDTGPYTIQQSCPIESTETSESLEKKLVILGIQALQRALQRLTENGVLSWHHQPSTGATYAKKLSKIEAKIDWSESAEQIDRKIRGFFPWPIAWWEHQGQPIKILKASIHLQDPTFYETLPYPSGTVLENSPQHLLVQTGEGVLACQRLQFPNRKPQDWSNLRHQKQLASWRTGYCLTANVNCIEKLL